MTVAAAITSAMKDQKQRDLRRFFYLFGSHGIPFWPTWPEPQRTEAAKIITREWRW